MNMAVRRLHHQPISIQYRSVTARSLPLTILWWIATTERGRATARLGTATVTLLLATGRRGRATDGRGAVTVASLPLPALLLPFPVAPLPFPVRSLPQAVLTSYYCEEQSELCLVTLWPNLNWYSLL